MPAGRIRDRIGLLRPATYYTPGLMLGFTGFSNACRHRVKGSLSLKEIFFYLKTVLLHFVRVDCIIKKVLFLFKDFVFKSPSHSPPPPENPQNWNFLPCLTPPSVFGQETWDLFYFVQNLDLYYSTSHLYQSYISKK